MIPKLEDQGSSVKDKFYKMEENLQREIKNMDKSFKYFVTEKGINWIMESD